MANRKMSEIMHEIKISEKGGVYDLSKLTKEQYVQFRYHFVEARMYDDLWLNNLNSKAMELLLGAFVLILCKRVPAELNLKRIEKLHEKVRFI